MHFSFWLRAFSIREIKGSIFNCFILNRVLTTIMKFSY
ncbi:Unknown protein sequence [Pseudomonas amygdali pv. morsprunorum]|nr:Unknown protein sequence [Pseudomonas amygdali pv. morsprunorum]